MDEKALHGVYDAHPCAEIKTERLPDQASPPTLRASQFAIMIHTQTHIRIRYAESDMMGFAHHQHYVAYFEQARVEMLTRIGIPYRELESMGFFLPVLEVQVKYLKSNTFDDEIVVHCIVDERPRARIAIRYEVYRGELLTTTGRSLHAFIDREGRPCRPPRAMTEKTDLFFDDISHTAHE